MKTLKLLIRGVFVNIIDNSRGLTLVELLATMVIFSIILVIAVSSILSTIHNTEDKAVISEIVALIDTAKISLADGSCNTSTKCKYGTDGLIDFKSSLISEAFFDFSNGTSPDSIMIEVELFPVEFKGRLKEEILLLLDNQPFTEKQLIELLNM